VREDQLIAFLVARGVDFEHVAGSSSDTKGEARRRRLTKEERKEADKAKRPPDVSETVSGNQTRVYKRPHWSLQELALAAKGMSVAPWLAVSLSIANDRTAIPHLVRELRVEAAHVARKESWPAVVPDVNGKPLEYFEGLIRLVLLEEEHRGRFVQAQPAPVHAWLMDVTEKTWDQALAPKYAKLQQRYEGWFCAGRALVRQRIMGMPDDELSGADRARIERV
jgi:hypothetical protein